MIAKNIMKKPILVIGILMMFIFLSNLYNKGYFSKRAELLKATSCRAVVVKLERRVPMTWEILCHNNNLTVKIPYSLSKNKTLKNPAMKSALLYRELANNLKLIALHSPDDNLERTFLIRVVLKSEDLVINSITEGKHLVRLRTLKTPEMIGEHLKRTVKVKETRRATTKK